MSHISVKSAKDQNQLPARKSFGVGRLFGMAAVVVMLVATSCHSSLDSKTMAPGSASMRADSAKSAEDRPDALANELVVLEAANSDELKKLEKNVAESSRKSADAPSPNTGPASAFGFGGGGGGGRPASVGGVRSAEAPRPRSVAGEAGRDAGHDPRRVGSGVQSDPDARTNDTVDGRQSAIDSAARITQAGQGELWAKPVIRADGAKEAVAFPLKHTNVNASVSGYVASTTVTQTYSNEFETPIEAVYVFPLPTDSAVNGFSMTIGERTILGLIRKRAEAKDIYEAAKRGGFTASLLEQERPNIFTQSIANIAPKQDIKVDITYHNQLKRVRGEYEYVFPMVVAPRYNAHAPDAERISPPTLPSGMRNGHDISLKVAVDAGLPIGRIQSINHKIAEKRISGNEIEVTLDRADNIPNRDFVLRFDVLGAAVQTGIVTHAVDDRGYLSVMFTPPTNPDAVDLSPREITFLLDISGSMNGVPMELSKRIMNMALDRLRPHDSFNIVYFASGNGQLWDLPRPNTPENVASAKEFLGRVRASGGTEMLAGLKRLFQTPKANNALRMVVFLTDGLIGNEPEILSEIKKNAEGSRFFIYGIGSYTNAYLIEGVAKHGRGYATTVHPRESANLDVTVEDFFSRIDAPCLTDITVDWGGLPVSEAYPALIPDVFAGHPVTLVAKYTPNTGGQSGTIKVRGRKAGAPVEYSIQVDLPAEDKANEAIASVWARQKIESLMDARLGSDRVDTAVLTEKIVEVALEHKLVSEGTSFVAVDDSKRVGDGSPKRVDVPVELPEGMSPENANSGAKSNASGR